MRPHATIRHVLTAAAVGAAAVLTPLPAIVATAPPAFANTVTTEGSLAEYELHDTFDGAVNNTPHYGLNSRLAARQQGSGAPVGYNRRSGYWSTTGSASSASNQVNHGSYAGKMSFHLPSGSAVPTTAVALDDPVVPSPQGLRVRATLSPLVNDDLALTAEHAWSSIVLTQSATSTGYVAGTDVELGVMVRSSGRVELYQEGNAVTLSSPNQGTYVDLLRTPSYDVTVTVNGSTATVLVTPINALGQPTTSTTITATVDVPTDRRHHLLLGNYFGPTVTASSPVSTVDDLKVWRVASLQHTGHYFTRSTKHGEHLAEVDDHANFNWVEDPEDLVGCGYRDCVLQARWQFFPDDTRQLITDPQDPYTARWGRLVDAIGDNHDRIAAFYVIDEPGWNGAQVGNYPSKSEFEISIDTIKASYPNIPVFTSYNRSVLVPRDADSNIQPGITCPTGEIIIDCLGGISAKLDWVGFASYGPIADADGASVIAGRMPSRMTAKQRLVLVPQGHRNSTTDISDETLASLNHQYLNLADDINDDYHLSPTGYRSVVGVLTFGRWTHNTLNGLPLSVAKTTGEQYCLGQEVLDRQTMSFHDSFDDADNSSGYGLNSLTDVRQCKSTWTQTGTSYVRRSGVWNTSTPPISSSNQVNHTSYQDRMSFHVGPSAVLVDEAIAPGNEGVRVSADLTPLVNDDAATTAENAWMTLMVSGLSGSNGWINDPNIELAVQVRSSGRVQIVSRGATVTPQGTTNTYVDVPRAATYAVDVVLDDDDVVVTVNGTVIRATLPDGAITQTSYYVYASSYWSSSIPYTSPVSTVDNLYVSKRKV